MLSVISLAACLALASAVSAQTEFITESTLGANYTYVVHQSSNYSNATAPPAILYLGGTGSQYIEGQTQAIDQVVSFGGPGWRIAQYYNGTTDPVNVLVDQQFLSIIPVYQKLLPNIEWDIPSVLAVLADARSKYLWDDTRLYLAGYSMGARTAWPMLIANPTPFAAAAIAAGVPVNNVDSRQPELNYTGMENLANIPIMQFAGESDYENASQVWEHQAIQNYMTNTLGFSNVQLVLEPNATHGDMQQAPFTLDLFNWFLSNSGNATATSVVGTASVQSASVSYSSSGLSPAETSGSQAAAVSKSSATSSIIVSAVTASLMIIVGLCVVL